MSRLFILTIGFEEKFAIRMITRHGLDIGDKLLIITGPIIDKVEKTITFLKDFIAKYYGKEIELEVYQVKPEEEFNWNLLRILERLSHETERYDKIIVNLSGGMRILNLLTYTATILLATKIRNKLTVELETEDSKALIRIPVETMITLTTAKTLTKEKIQILKLLQGEPLTVKQLAHKLEKDQSTIRRHIQDLISLGLVKPITLQKPMRYQVTPQSRIVLKLLKNEYFK